MPIENKFAGKSHTISSEKQKQTSTLTTCLPAHAQSDNYHYLW